MGRLIYSAITSLDGYVADADGDFTWSAPDEEVHAFLNDLERSTGTMLLGRRMYEVLAVWDDISALPDQRPVMLDFAQIWQSADKIVYSRTLEAPSTARTRIERDFDREAVRRLKAESVADLSVGGPELAAVALRAGLVDEIQLYLNPIAVGAGTRALPDDVRLHLDLIDEHRFNNGVIHLRYRVR
ncbi:dihydrofolate reductase family protein [Saccharopolyspora sp. WRP15-2]|uniref:Dihydrofolate reductase family protein n=1 Tax=Saccharopolyspora oryzae TaxID=2997343 RepID=A0ABT4V454_9PSEU|nr:dihydrofolate reductase family protein [Saccharopolyspora oryzae]MDA3628735.1 dihydrofolate reductase family protein [Saccharopolyspora oryzae]